MFLVNIFVRYNSVKTVDLLHNKKMVQEVALTWPPMDMPVTPRGQKPCRSHQWNSTRLSRIKQPPITNISDTLCKIDLLSTHIYCTMRIHDNSVNLIWRCYNVFINLTLKLSFDASHFTLYARNHIAESKHSVLWNLKMKNESTVTSFMFITYFYR